MADVSIQASPDDLAHAYLARREREAYSDDAVIAQARVAASAALPGTEEAVTPTAPDDEEPRSFFERIGAVASDISRGAVEAPLQAVSGVSRAVEETSQGVGALADFLDAHVPDWARGGVLDPLSLVNAARAQEGQEPIKPSDAALDLPDIKEPETTTGALVRGVSQFLTGFVTAGKVLGTAAGASRGAQVVNAAVRGAIADASVFDPHEERLSNLIESFPALQNPVTEYLAAEPDDSEAEGRFKNALEGIGLGLMTDGFMAAVRTLRGARQGRTAVAQAGGQADEVLEQAARADIDEREFLILGDPKKPVVTPADARKAQQFLNMTTEELPDRAVNINLARINAPDDIKEAIERTARTFEGEIDQARRGVQTNEATQRLADEVGLTVDDLLRRRSGQAFNAEEALAARRLLVSSADNLVEQAKTIRAGTASEVDIFRFRKALAVHSAIQEQVSGLTAEAGRALQAFQIPAGGSEVRTRAIREMIDAGGGADFHRQMAEMLTTLDSPEAVNRFAREAAGATTKDMLLEAWINSLLSGPQTQAVNVLSNSLVALWQVPERYLASKIGQLAGTADGVAAGEATAQMFGMARGIRDGMKLAGRVLRTGEPSDVLTKIEVSAHRAITAKNLSRTALGRVINAVSGDSLERAGTIARGVDLMGETVRLPGRFLQAGDEFFKAVGYRMELQARAYRQALAEGLDGGRLAERIEEIIAHPPDDIHLAAIDAARYQTFTNELGEFGKGLSRLRNSSVPARLILPFLRTPVNIVKFAGARTPFAPFMQSVRADIVAGGARRDLALARMAMGSMVMAATADLAAQGHITGGGPSDFRTRRIWLNKYQPYSIRIGDTWYAYSRLEPLGMLFGIAADSADIMGQLDDADAADLATASVAAVSKNITSKTWLRGVSEFVSTLDNPDRRGRDFIKNFAGTIIPTGVAQVERVGDPALRETRDLTGWDEIYNQIKSRVPGWSESLPPRRNVWGDTIILGGGLGPDIISPIYTQEEVDSPIDEELLRLDMPIGMPPRSFRSGPFSVEMTPEEYDRLLVLQGSEVKDPQTGMGMKDTLDALVSGTHPMAREYAAASDGREGGKALLIRSIVGGFRSAARQQVLEEFPELGAAVEQARRQQAEALQE